MIIVVPYTLMRKCDFMELFHRRVLKSLLYKELFTLKSPGSDLTQFLVFRVKPDPFLSQADSETGLSSQHCRNHSRFDTLFSGSFYTTPLEAKMYKLWLENCSIVLILYEIYNKN